MDEKVQAIASLIKSKNYRKHLPEIRAHIKHFDSAMHNKVTYKNELSVMKSVVYAVFAWRRKEVLSIIVDMLKSPILYYEAYEELLPYIFDLILITIKSNDPFLSSIEDLGLIYTFSERIYKLMLIKGGANNPYIYYKILEVLLRNKFNPDYGATPDENSFPILRDRVHVNDLHSIRLLLKYNANIFSNNINISDFMHVEAKLVFLSHIFSDDYSGDYGQPKNIFELINNNVLFIQEYHQHMYILVENCTLLHFILSKLDLFEPMLLIEIMRFTSYAALLNIIRPKCLE